MATQTFYNSTLYLRSEMFGNVQRIDVSEVTVEEGQKYAQYDNATKVVFVPKGKRSKRGTWVVSRPFIVIVRREQAIQPDDMLGPAEKGVSGLEIRRSRYHSFDDRYITDFCTQLAAAAVEPLYQQISGERGR